jgi:hypothetical protein
VHALAESIEYPTIAGSSNDKDVAYAVQSIGEPLSALMHAKEDTDPLSTGDIYGQAGSLYFQARCHIVLANYRHARYPLQKSRDMLTACGQQQSTLGLLILNHQGEIHLVKSEYRESRQLQAAIASSCHPTSYAAVLANLNIALIDIATGADSKIIGQNLDMVQSHLKALYGYNGRAACLLGDFATTELCLQDGALETANAMFEKCFASSLDTWGKCPSFVRQVTPT